MDLRLDMVRREALRQSEQSGAAVPAQGPREMKLVLSVGEEGLVRSASFLQSSRNRMIDLAARNWAYGLMLKPLDCGGAYQYQVVLPITIPASTGGA